MSKNRSDSTGNLILAIDVGSSWCKAAYIDRDGRFLAGGRVPTGNADVSGDALLTRHWQAIVRCSRDATESLSETSGEMHAPAAINFSCRGLLGVGIDKRGNSWMLADNANVLAKYRETTSSASLTGELEDELVRFGYGSRHGAFLGWLSENDPGTWQRIHKAGGLRDWIAYRLTGEWVTDATIGPGRLAWPDELIAESGLPPSAFARILGPTELAGRLLPDVANELGLTPGIPVVSGMHDGAAANVGVGAIYEGTTCLTLGTNFSLRAVTGPRLLNAFSYVILPEQWAWVDNAPNASGRLDAVARFLSLNGETLADTHARLGVESGQVPPGCEGYRFPALPPRDLSRLELEVESARARGVAGPVVYRAIVEQICYEVGWLLARARRAGASPTSFVATGGSIRNTLLLRVLSAVIGKPISRGEPDAGLLGVAIAAAVAVGWYESIDDAVAKVVRHDGAVTPDPDDIDRYQHLWNQWASDHPGLEM